MQHLLTLNDWSDEQLHQVVDLALDVKVNPKAYEDRMHRKTLFMLFEKPSLRTRVSFEVGMNQLGGHALYYDLSNSPLGSGKETVADTTKTVSRYSDMVMARVYEHDSLVEMAKYSDVPLINGLSNYSHPCQIVADLLTIKEKKGTLEGLTLAYVGDSNNNVTHSLLFGCAKVGMNVQVGCPKGAAYEPVSKVLDEAKAIADNHGTRLEMVHDILEATKGADVVYTDSWMSYHIPKDELEVRVANLSPFQVTSAVMKTANKDALFMNCLPAMRGYEQTAEVIDGPQSVVFDEAENRLHAHKAIVLTLLDG